MPVPEEDEPDAVHEALAAASLDDYLAGFTTEPPTGQAAVDADPDAAGILDTILLLRQAVAPAEAVAAAAVMPRSIGRHAILRLAGEGGFAIVWEGFDTRLRRPVAVKVRRPELLLSAEARRRFVREAEIAARLVHPHIVTIYEVGEDAGREFIAVEYCSGGSLAQWLDRHPGPLSPRTAARIVRAIAGAVACAHDAGVVHRDIKPANVFLVPAPPGSEPLLAGPMPEDVGFSVKLGDFGLGKVHDEIDAADPLTQLTRTGARIGTPAWMAPEQADRSLGAIGPATDVYALGLLLDRLLTGRALRGGATDTEIYRQVLIDDPVSADRVVRGVPRDLAAVATKCLARQPAARYASAADLAADLDRWLAGRPTVARPVSPLGHAARLIRRRPVVAALVAVAVAAVAAAGWVGLDRSRAVARREDEIRRQRGLEELRRGFEAMRAGNVAAAVEQLAKTRAADPELADSLAGRWLVRRTHGEHEILLPAPADEPSAAQRPRDLYAIARVADGTTAAVAGADGSIRLLRDLDGRPSLTVVAAHDEVNDVAFSPDGTFLASVGQDGRLRWWRLTLEGLVTAGEVIPGAGPLYAAAWSPDGRTIATGGEDRVVRLVHLDTADRVRELFRFAPPPGKSPDIESLAFVSPDLLAAACGGSVVLLDSAAGHLVRECERPFEPQSSAVCGDLVVAPDGKRLMACGTDAKAHVWDIATGRLMLSLPSHPAWVQGAAFSADGGQIATACRDGGLRIFDAATARLLDRRVGHMGRVWSVAWEPAGTLLTAGADGTVRRWDLNRSADEAAFTAGAVAPTAVNEIVAGWSRPLEGPAVLAVCEAETILAIDPVAAAVSPFATDDIGHVWRVAVDGRSGRLAFSRRTGEPVLVVSHAAAATVMPVALPDSADAVDALVAWTPAGDLVVRSSDGGLVWCLSGTGPARRFGTAAGVVTDLAAAPAGPPRVAVAGDRATLHPLPQSLAAGRLQPSVELAVDGQSSAVAWSPDGSLVAVGSRGGVVHLFEAATGTALGQCAPHERAIEGLAFSPDGRILVSADETCVRISAVATLATLDELRPGFKIRAILVTADGCRLLAGGFAGNLSGMDSGRLAVMDLPEPSRR